VLYGESMVQHSTGSLQDSAKYFGMGKFGGQIFNPVISQLLVGAILYPLAWLVLLLLQQQYSISIFRYSILEVVACGGWFNSI
jgi:hypothetical protein